MSKKKPHKVSPEAAKILEQYRNAGKPQPAAVDENGAPIPAENAPGTRPTAPPNPTLRQRSGVRGK